MEKASTQNKKIPKSKSCFLHLTSYFLLNKAQAVMGEYVLVVFLAIGMATAMTIYFKRGVHARIHDARDAMLNIVVNRTAGYYTGNIQIGYEPYYADTESAVARGGNTRIELLPGATTGIFRKTSDGITAVRTHSETAPPRDAK